MIRRISFKKSDLIFLENYFCKEKNEVIFNMLIDSVLYLRLIVFIFWYRIFYLFGDYFVSNIDEVVVNIML